MKTKTKSMDIHDLLHSDNKIADCINVAYHDEDPRMSLIDLGNTLRCKGFSEVARKSGLGRESLYKTFF